ncbi:helix-turn-helix domain-containing protein [Enterobacter cloacae]|uniref:winged helix-turn-helix domain-containing protein n=1 Tax=Enterobacter cloacae TaxID=550 RepID=UPI0020031446|nr:helix-turn-helix domain-containing protein [Enterobacter cloacae]MCK7268881.1 helix-turn-helix domain-containing protein [Enterobacter cloacae]
MQYIINNMIGYRPADGTLWHVDNDAEILTLSPTSNRLLSVLLTNRNGIISRDELLKKTWDDYGLVSSNNSLNHYISALRKKFESLGMTEEIIKTEPKMGFRIPDTVDIQCSYDQQGIRKKEIRYKKPLLFCGAALCVVCILSLILLNVQRLKAVDNHYTTASIGKIGMCDVHPLKNNLNQKPEYILSLTNTFVRENDIKCDIKNVVYFSADNRVIAGEAGRVYFAFCETIGNKVQSCVNYLVQDWKQ